MTEVLMVIAPEQFRDEEYAVPKEILEGRSAHVVTASVAPGPCRGKLGMTATAEQSIANLDAEGFDAVVFVGGGGSQIYFDDAVAHDLVHSALETGAVLGAICIAPSILAHAGVLEGRRVTSFPSQQEDLSAHGAIYTGASVEVDGPFITASGPEAAFDFGMTVGDAIGLP